MPSETYLYRLRKSFYYRRRVPRDLQQFFKKAETRKALRTRSVHLAEKLGGAWDHHAESLFALLRSGVLDARQARNMTTRFMESSFSEVRQGREVTANEAMARDSVSVTTSGACKCESRSDLLSMSLFLAQAALAELGARMWIPSAWSGSAVE